MTTLAGAKIRRFREERALTRAGFGAWYDTPGSTVQGWEEDAKRIAAAGLTEEEREWLDADLTSGTDAEALGDDWTEDELAELEAALAANESEPS